MTLFVDDPDFRLYVGDVREQLRLLPDASVDCVVTSPPYWGLRDYQTGEWDGGDLDVTIARRRGIRFRVRRASGKGARTRKRNATRTSVMNAASVAPGASIGRSGWRRRRRSTSR